MKAKSASRTSKDKKPPDNAWELDVECHHIVD